MRKPLQENSPSSDLTDDISKDTNQINILKSEYEILSQGIDETYSRISQLITLGTTALGGLIGLIGLTVSQTVNISFLFYLFTPAIIMLVYAIALVYAARWSSLIFQIRLIVDRLAELTGQPKYLFYYHRESLASRFLSLASGSSKYRLVLYAIFSVATTLFIFLIVLIYNEIYPSKHFLGLIFLISYAGIMLVLGFGLYSVVVEMPNYYKEAFESVITQNRYHHREFSHYINQTVNILAVLIPRPFDFIVKTWLFLAGALIFFWEYPLHFNPRIWDIFVNIPSTSTPPIITILAFSILWYLIEEGLVQQAKYLWNDIRDQKIDRNDISKSNRPVTRNAINRQFAVMSLIVRTILGLSLGFLVDPRLFFLSAWILLLHTIYELWAKPRGGTLPLVALCLVAMGSLTRVIGGAMSVGVSQIDMKFFEIMLIFFLLSAGYISTFWRIEAEFKVKQANSEGKKPEFNRAASIYFLNKGRTWQYLSFYSMTFMSVLLLTQTFFCKQISSCTYFPSAMNHLWHLKDWGINTNLILPIFILVGLVMFLVGYYLWKVLVQRLAKQTSFGYILLAIVISLLFIMKLFLNIQIPRVYVLPGVLIIFSIITTFSYENIDYEGFMMIHLKRNLSKIMKLWFYYIFTANTPLRLPFVLSITADLASGKLDTNELDEILEAPA